MLFYAALTVLSVIAAATIIWLMQRMSAAGKKAYRNHAGSRVKRDTRIAHLNSNLAQTPSPWGWGHRRHGRAEHVRNFGRGDGHHHAQPLKPTSNRPATDEPHTVHSARNVLTGYDLTKSSGTMDTSSWPYRESTSSDSDEEDRPRRLRVHRPTKRSGYTKPWGW